MGFTLASSAPFCKHQAQRSDPALELFGVQGVVEVTALMGYYSMVAMTLLAHDMPVAADAPVPKLAPRRASAR